LPSWGSEIFSSEKILVTNSRHFHILKISSPKGGRFLLCGSEQANCFACVRESKGLSMFLRTKSEKTRKSPGYVVADSRHRLASLSNPERKNTPCISDLAGVEFLLKKERGFFFRGSALQVFGQCGGAKCGLGFAKAIFWGKRIFRFTSALVPPAERGLGNECGRACFSKIFWRIYD